MQPIPIRTTVVGSYPFPGWLEFAAQNLQSFGAADIEEMAEKLGIKIDPKCRFTSKCRLYRR